MTEAPSHRYALGPGISSGGMATLHLGRLVGSAGFARIVAIKKLHQHLCADPTFVTSFADEARLAARIRHPNVVPTLDVVSAEGELLLVMEYVDGESLSALARTARDGERIPLPIVVAIVSEMLHGLHAAHEAKSEDGTPLGLVHRDVSPQNVLVGADGVARLVDFGIARVTNRVGNTAEGELKGKLAYMAPEQIRLEPVTRKADIFAAGVVLWELLTGQRLFASDNPGSTLEKILVGWVAPPSSIVRDLPPALDEIALRALDADPNARFDSARDMAIALEDACSRALGREVATWVEKNAAETLAKKREAVASAEREGLSPPTPTTTATRQSAPDSIGIAATVPIRPALRPPPLPPTPDHRRRRESELTATAFADADVTAAPPPARSRRHTDGATSTEGAYEPPPTLLSPIPHPTARRTGSAPRAIALVALAAAITLIFGTRYVRAHAAESAAAAPVAEATLVEVAKVEAAPTARGPVETVTAAVPVAPPSTPPPRQAAAAPSPPPRRASAAAAAGRGRPPAAPTRLPCVAKLDPATGKTVYKGDCD